MERRKVDRAVVHKEVEKIIATCKVYADIKDLSEVNSCREEPAESLDQKALDGLITFLEEHLSIAETKSAQFIYCTTSELNLAMNGQFFSRLRFDV